MRSPATTPWSIILRYGKGTPTLARVMSAGATPSPMISRRACTAAMVWRARTRLKLVIRDRRLGLEGLGEELRRRATGDRRPERTRPRKGAGRGEPRLRGAPAATPLLSASRSPSQRDVLAPLWRRRKGAASARRSRGRGLLRLASRSSRRAVTRPRRRGRGSRPARSAMKDRRASSALAEPRHHVVARRGGRRPLPLRCGPAQRDRERRRDDERAGRRSRGEMDVVPSERRGAPQASATPAGEARTVAGSKSSSACPSAVLHAAIHAPTCRRSAAARCPASSGKTPLVTACGVRAERSSVVTSGSAAARASPCRSPTGLREHTRTARGGLSRHEFSSTSTRTAFGSALERVAPPASSAGAHDHLGSWARACGCRGIMRYSPLPALRR